MFTDFDCQRQREFLDGLLAEIDWLETCRQSTRRQRALLKRETANLELMERHPFSDSDQAAITLDTRFLLTQAGSAALDAAPQGRCLTRKRRLIPALAAKQTGAILRIRKQTRTH